MPAPELQLDDIEPGLRDWITQGEEQALQFVKTMVIDIFKEAVQLTPVDTGLLRGSWNIGIDEESSRRATPRGNGKFKTADSNLSLSKARGIRLGHTVVISNPVEYAGFVEEGTSRTPPKKMLRTAVDNVVASVTGGI